MCDVKIRPFGQVNPTVELTCEETDEGHYEHWGVLRDYAWEGSATKIHWYEGDRRAYRGEWPGRCPGPQSGMPADCTLPLGHRGRHNLE